MREIKNLNGRKFEKNKTIRTLELSYPSQDIIDDFWLQINETIQSNKHRKQVSLK